MHWTKTLHAHYIKYLPYSTITTTGISTYISVKNEMKRPFHIPPIYSIRNVLLSGGLGALTGLCYPLTFPCIGTFYIYNVYKSQIP